MHGALDEGVGTFYNCMFPKKKLLIDTFRGRIKLLSQLPQLL
jgi:hypothetical protein